VTFHSYVELPDGYIPAIFFFIAAGNDVSYAFSTIHNWEATDIGQWTRRVNYEASRLANICGL
jgi:hypothetical protein